MKPSLPANETQRLAKLHSYHILDTPPEAAYDDLTALAAHICDAPIALMSLVDAERQWAKSKLGWELGELRRDCAFSAHAILNSQVLVVPDTTQDARFADNFLVVSQPHIRFYAGAPLITPDGFAIGALCVMDTQPRHLSPAQIVALEALSRQAIAQLELQKKIRILDREKRDRQQLEAQLKQQMLAIEAAVDGIAILNDGEHYSYLNRAHVEVLGYESEEELLGKSWRMLYSEAELQRFQRDIFPVIMEKGFWRGECIARRKDGSTFHQEIALTMTDVGLICVCRDISERKQAEVALLESMETLKRTQLQMIQSEKMSSLGQLVAGVAHEINNPVNFIHGNLAHIHGYIENLFGLIDLYQQHCPALTSDVQAAIEDMDLDFLKADFPNLLCSMHAGTDRIRQIVLSLRNFSRMDEAEVKEVNINQGIESTLTILQNRLKAQTNRPEIFVRKEYGNLPLIQCFAGQLNQVFMNLLSNAIDALEEAFEAGKQQHPAIAVSTKVTNQQKLYICIKDNGTGIPAEIQQRIFDPFFTTKPVGRGTGLGLSISYQIVVERHGGEFRCISAPGEGTTFEIEIPIRR